MLKTVNWRVLLLVPVMLWVSAFTQASEQASNLVNDYYRHAKAFDMAELEKLFLADARFKSVWKYGYGVPDETVEYSLAELKEFLDPAQLKDNPQMQGYTQLGQSSKILSVSEQGDRIEVKAVETVLYEVQYEGAPWKGEIKSTDTFLLKRVGDTLKISAMELDKQF